MAVLTTRAVAATVSALTSRIRKIVGDRNSVRFSNADIYEAIDSALQWMHNEMHAAHPMTGSSDVTYTGDATSVALPTGIEGQQLYYLLDVTESDSPVYIEYTEPTELEKHAKVSAWTLVNQQLAIRPTPTDNRTIRVFYLNNYIPVKNSATPSTDQHAYIVNFERLIELLAATELQEDDEEIPKTRLLRLQELKEQFLIFAAAYRGPEFVRDVRTYKW